LHDSIGAILTRSSLVVFGNSLRTRDNVCCVYGLRLLRVLLLMEVEKHTTGDQRKVLIPGCACLLLSDVDVDIERPGKQSVSDLSTLSATRLRL
jgi:hypothetical protein